MIDNLEYLMRLCLTSRRGVEGHLITYFPTNWGVECCWMPVAFSIKLLKWGLESPLGTLGKWDMTFLLGIEFKGMDTIKFNREEGIIIYFSLSVKGSLYS